jgi:lipopolysaccharide transport protein LptA
MNPSLILLLAALPILPSAQAPEREAAPTRPAKITSRSTYYDRKEGFACFNGEVHVDDERYQMHADKAYVFMEGTNDLKRIVALGNVALTNDTKRAYGAKLSYHRNPGLVILYGGDGKLAEVRDESKDGDQVVKGAKIKFWIDAEQVEVIESDISVPAKSGGNLKGLITR